jgi:hypothetical protein
LHIIFTPSASPLHYTAHHPCQSRYREASRGVALIFSVTFTPQLEGRNPEYIIQHMRNPAIRMAQERKKSIEGLKYEEKISPPISNCK